ncbi:MAG: hypothetical protein OHK0017_13140 [Patescibacteria group bacterium]
MLIFELGYYAMIFLSRLFFTWGKLGKNVIINEEQQQIQVGELMFDFAEVAEVWWKYSRYSGFTFNLRTKTGINYGSFNYKAIEIVNKMKTLLGQD